MQWNPSLAIERIRTATSFESLCETLRSERYAAHRKKPLTFWSLPSDRRMPSVFRKCSLGELVGTSYSALTATPGIGQRKVQRLVELLRRAANTAPEDLSPETALPRRGGKRKHADRAAPPDAPETDAGGPLDIDCVSEVDWGKWRASAVALGLENEPLGRLTPSLRALPSASWNTPLGQYTGHTLCEIREMKAHGPKRLRAILDVVHDAYRITSGATAPERLAAPACPARVASVEQWIRQTRRAAAVPRRGEILERFIRPLLEQLQLDASRQAVTLARYRLGMDGPITTICQTAERMGLTRARLYQLLDIINDILTLRWPAGRRQVHELCDRWRVSAGDGANAEELSQFFRAVELFYPVRRRLAMIASRRREGRRRD